MNTTTLERTRLEHSTNILPTPTLVSRKIILKPDPLNPLQAGGIINPAVFTGKNGEQYMITREVERGNRSHLTLCELTINGGNCKVLRRGVVLAHDLNQGWSSLLGEGGLEDPRVSWINALGCYVMAYTIFDGLRARIALATSTDVLNWTPHGLIKFENERNAPHLDAIDNKDAIVFAEPCEIDGELCLVLMHRPMFELEDPAKELPPGVTDRRQSIWMSFCPLAGIGLNLSGLTIWKNHVEVMTPGNRRCESAKLGGGTPPLHIGGHLLIFTHGVEYLLGRDGNKISDGGTGHKRRYSAGYAWLDARDPRLVLQRSTVPVMVPRLKAERSGIVNNVVFPTGALEHDGQIWVFSGAGDRAISMARFDLSAPLAQALAA